MPCCAAGVKIITIVCYPEAKRVSCDSSTTPSPCRWCEDYRRRYQEAKWREVSCSSSATPQVPHPVSVNLTKSSKAFYYQHLFSVKFKPLSSFVLYSALKIEYERSSFPNCNSGGNLENGWLVATPSAWGEIVFPFRTITVGADHGSRTFVNPL